MLLKSLILLVLISSCTSTNENSSIIIASTTNERTIEERKYFVGDIDNDKISDTAFVCLKRNNETEDRESKGEQSTIIIKFKNGIPDINYEQSLGVHILKTEDLNNDSANEILIFSRTEEGWWNNISAYSFDGHTWKVLAETKAIISENKDFENRILKENDNYYLIGDDKWNEDKKGAFLKIKIKI